MVLLFIWNSVWFVSFCWYSFLEYPSSLFILSSLLPCLPPFFSPFFPISLLYVKPLTWLQMHLYKKVYSEKCYPRSHSLYPFHPIPTHTLYIPNLNSRWILFPVCLLEQWSDACTFSHETFLCFFEGCCITDTLLALCSFHGTVYLSNPSTSVHRHIHRDRPHFCFTSSQYSFVWI